MTCILLLSLLLAHMTRNPRTAYAQFHKESEKIILRIIRFRKDGFSQFDHVTWYLVANSNGKWEGYIFEI
jgi:hypothetical protein